MDWLKHSDWLTPLDLAVLFVSLFCVWEMCSLCDGQHTNHKQYKRMMKILIWKVKLNLPTSEKREYFRATQRSLYLSRCLFHLQKMSGRSPTWEVPTTQEPSQWKTVKQCIGFTWCQNSPSVLTRGGCVCVCVCFYIKNIQQSVLCMADSDSSQTWICKHCLERGFAGTLLFL